MDSIVSADKQAVLMSYCELVVDIRNSHLEVFVYRIDHTFQQVHSRLSSVPCHMSHSSP